MLERIFGLDGEMSGVETTLGHRLIQIGVAVDTTPDGEALETPDLFVSYIGWHDEDLTWSDQAERVHGISRETVLSAPPAYEVDEALCEWLYDHGADPSSRRKQIMCGFNVGVFDAPFLAIALPKTKEFFARRYADLNPLSFVLASSKVEYNGASMSSAGWKRRFRAEGLEYAQSAGRFAAEHDAGTDALQALGAWRFTERILLQQKEEAREARQSRKDRRLREIASA